MKHHIRIAQHILMQKAKHRIRFELREAGYRLSWIPREQVTKLARDALTRGLVADYWYEGEHNAMEN